MVETSEVLRLGEGKPIEGVLVLRMLELDGLKGDKSSKSKEYELILFEGDESKSG
jgi:hypothetical protein